MTSEHEEDMEIAEGVTSSCHSSYRKSKTGIGPEAFGSNGLTYGRDGYYILRPETVESYEFKINLKNKVNLFRFTAACLF